MQRYAPPRRDHKDGQVEARVGLLLVILVPERFPSRHEDGHRERMREAFKVLLGDPKILRFKRVHELQHLGTRDTEKRHQEHQGMDRSMPGWTNRCLDDINHLCLGINFHGGDDDEARVLASSTTNEQAMPTSSWRMECMEMAHPLIP